MLKPKFYLIIIIFSILQIISGLFLIAGSLPLFTLYKNIQDGEMRVETDNLHIEKVMPLSPAAAANLTAGDMIISANGTNVSIPNDFTGIVNKNRGKVMEVVINRHGELKQFQLTPRIENPPNEGPTGIVISNFKFQKEPLIWLIPKTLFQNVSWDMFTAKTNSIAGPIGILFQKEYFRPLVFTGGVILIIVAIGLITLRKWAMYGMFILFFIDLVQTLYYIGKIQSSYPVSSIMLAIFGYLLSILFLLYLYSQRRFFK